MRYDNIHKAVFLARPNRFIAQVLVDGREETVHVKNTGRCKELLVPGCTVYLEKSANPARKTAYDLVTVEKALGPVSPDTGRPGAIVGRDDPSAIVGRDGPSAIVGRDDPGAPYRLINMDSQAPNKLFAEWAQAGHFVPNLTLLRPETTWGHSRFDFYWEAGDRAGFEPAPTKANIPSPVGAGSKPARRGFVEVKGCTLEEDNWTYFPDAPTERGVKHLEELLLAREQGYEAAVCIVIQMMGVEGFSPNDRTHPQFGAALRKAAAGGVEVLAYQCRVVPGEVVMTDPVPVKL